MNRVTGCGSMIRIRRMSAVFVCGKGGFGRYGR